jgi:NTP pyrophosphatase (non-canonical NTP hydrolase)
MEITNFVELQKYIRERDHNPELKDKYFFKLVEEVGELSDALRKNRLMSSGEDFKGSINEELYDVIYYVLAIANLNNIDITESINQKIELNKSRSWN